MKKMQLSILLKIIGIGSASGIVYQDDNLYIISDSSTFLYQYPLSTQVLNKIPLVKNPQENIPKKDKLDFEAITLKGNKLHILGSASTSNRTKTISYHLKSGKIKKRDLTDFYQTIKQKLSIDDDELNIEGVIFYNEELFLFQRGNGAKAKNGIIKVNDVDNLTIEFIPFNLTKLKNVEATFTDAILVEDSIYFLASAEDTTSTYTDGEVLGSIIGKIDIKTMKVEYTEIISNSQKFEGVTLYRKSTDQMEFLLCEDNDTETLISTIYKLTLKN